MYPLLEDLIRRQTEALNRLVDQMAKAESVNYTTAEAGEVLGYSEHQAQAALKAHRLNGDLKLFKGERYILYDKAEVLELRKKLFSQHKNKSLNKAA